MNVPALAPGLVILAPKITHSIIQISIIQTLDYLNSSVDCSTRVFCQQVYILLYFVKRCMFY